MKLINVATLQIESFNDEAIPKYAILSHTWETGEVSFQDFQNIATARTMLGFAKIEATCRRARQDKLHYAWVDTCCIDKNSSAEISESINSMFQYYQCSEICYVLLSDMPASGSVAHHLPQCRWFTRGWTLQELLAPGSVRFYDQIWGCFGTKASLSDRLCQITGIPKDVLLDCSRIREYPIAVRMAWAASRSTTRVEDIAYSLLGIFDINMPMLYGEGSKAFHRLQVEICQTDYDTSILCWGSPKSKPSDVSRLFAKSPAEFSGHEESGKQRFMFSISTSMEMTSRGPRMIRSRLCSVVVPPESKWIQSSSSGVLRHAVIPEPVRLPQGDNGGKIRYVLPLDIGASGYQYGIFLEKVHPDLLRRDCKLPLALLPNDVEYRPLYHQDFVILSGQSGYQRSDNMHLGKSNSLHIPFDTNLTISRIIPSTSWDPCRRLLFSPRIKSQIQAFKLEVDMGPACVGLWLLYDRRTNSSTDLPKARLLDPERHQNVERSLLKLLRQANYAYRECYLDDLDIDPQEIENIEDYVVLKVKGRTRRILVVMETQRLVENDIEIYMFSAKLQIR